MNKPCMGNSGILLCKNLLLLLLLLLLACCSAVKQVTRRLYLVAQVMDVFELAPQIIHEVLEGLQADCCPSLLWPNSSSSSFAALLTVILSSEC